jgi:hypothetical protein
VLSRSPSPSPHATALAARLRPCSLTLLLVAACNQASPAQPATGATASAASAPAGGPKHPCEALDTDEMGRVFSKSFHPGQRQDRSATTMRCVWEIYSGASGAVAFELQSADVRKQYDQRKAEPGAEAIATVPGQPVWNAAKRQYTFLVGGRLGTLELPALLGPKGLGEQFVKLVIPRLSKGTSP